MIYSLSNPRFLNMIDEHATGHWGEDMWGDERLVCCSCGEPIRSGDIYYDINDEIYCHRCPEMADDAILEACRENYTYEME